jgi:hypothetical protein
MIDAKDINLIGNICRSEGYLDPQGVMGNAGEITVNGSDVVSVGILRVYGRKGFFKLVKTADGKVVKVIMTKQDKKAHKWMDEQTAGMRHPTFSSLGGGFTSVVWKDFPETN